MELRLCVSVTGRHHRNRGSKTASVIVNISLLVGARPRSKGMERKDLLEANSAIFISQGRALDEVLHRE